MRANLDEQGRERLDAKLAGTDAEQLRKYCDVERTLAVPISFHNAIVHQILFEHGYAVWSSDEKFQAIAKERVWAKFSPDRQIGMINTEARLHLLQTGALLAGCTKEEFKQLDGSTLEKYVLHPDARPEVLRRVGGRLDELDLEMGNYRLEAERVPDWPGKIVVREAMPLIGYGEFAGIRRGGSFVKALGRVLKAFASHPNNPEQTGVRSRTHTCCESFSSAITPGHRYAPRSRRLSSR